jgi:hypothetical protein
MRFLHIVEDTPIIIHGKIKKKSMTGFWGAHRPACPLTIIKVLSYWTVDTLRDLQSTSRGLDPGIKM